MSGGSPPATTDLEESHSSSGEEVVDNRPSGGGKVPANTQLVNEGPLQDYSAALMANPYSAALLAASPATSLSSLASVATAQQQALTLDYARGYGGGPPGAATTPFMLPLSALGAGLGSVPPYMGSFPLPYGVGVFPPAALSEHLLVRRPSPGSNSSDDGGAERWADEELARLDAEAENAEVDTETYKRAKRRIKNRVAAQHSRQRKRDYVRELETLNVSLQSQISALQAHIADLHRQFALQAAQLSLLESGDLRVGDPARANTNLVVPVKRGRKMGSGV